MGSTLVAPVLAQVSDTQLRAANLARMKAEAIGRQANLDFVWFCMIWAWTFYWSIFAWLESLEAGIRLK